MNAATIDHLLLGCADLEVGIEWFTARTGVRPAMGGEHAQWGTHNALVSLGPRQYLELIAPKRSLGPYRLFIDVRDCDPPRLVTWAVAVPDLDRALRAAAAGGIATTDAIAGGRLRPDGRHLMWRTARPLAEPARPDLDVWPFVIEWGADTPHPSLDAPAGCTLASFEVTSNESSSPSPWLAALGLDHPIATATPSLRAALQTPRGLLTLAS